MSAICTQPGLTGVPHCRILRTADTAERATIERGVPVGTRFWSNMILRPLTRIDAEMHDTHPEAIGRDVYRG